MHEASIVENLVGLIEREAPAGARISRVNIRVGLLSGISPECMQFYFEFFRENTIASGAQLLVEMAPLSATCPSCGATIELKELTWTCPCCEGGPLAFANGHELDLVSMEVEDGASHLD